MHKLFILQRTTAHPEIQQNRNWKISKECYICKRWKYTLIISEKPAFALGSFEMLYAPKSQPVRLLDIRELARSITEVNGDEEFDWNTYLKLLSSSELAKIKSSPESIADTKQLFRSKDIRLYTSCWYEAFKSRLTVKNYQTLPTRPEPFDIDAHKT